MKGGQGFRESNPEDGMLPMSSWNEQELLLNSTYDSMFWRNETGISCRNTDNLENCVNHALQDSLESYVQGLELTEHNEDLCKKYLREELPVLDAARIPEPLPATSFLETEYKDTSEQLQRRTLSNVLLHNKQVEFCQKNPGSFTFPEENRETLIYQQNYTLNTCSDRGVSELKVWNPSCSVEHLGSVPIQAKTNTNIILHTDSNKLQYMKYSNFQEVFKQSLMEDKLRDFSHTEHLPIEESKKSFEFADYSERRMVADWKERSYFSVPNSHVEFDCWRQSINQFLTNIGLSRREFAKFAKIGKNTVGKYLSGHCKKLSGEVVFKMISTYQTLQKGLSVTEFGLLGTSEAFKKRRTRKMQREKTCQSTVYLCSLTQLDCLNKMDSVGTESLTIEDTKTSDDILWSSLEEQLSWELHENDLSQGTAESAMESMTE